MCGFVGFYDNIRSSETGDDSVSRNEAIVRAMSDTIAHRGPDGEGFFVDGRVALGHRRLSIIDLAGGAQPMISPDGRYVIVFNGEIYNFRELRGELHDSFGDELLTDCDTEVVLRAYIRYGEALLPRLRGMFAFVIYDKQEGTLFGARDYFGIKPFYYALMDDVFMFGSEIKSFLPHPRFQKQINPDALKLYLTFQYSPLSETIFKGVYKLLPGTYFNYSAGELKTARYFTPKFEEAASSDSETVDKIDAAVVSSVEYHQIADVEVGSFLSGGVDSSYVASTVHPMTTYSVGFEIEGFDETTLAAELSAKLGMENKRREITPDDFFDALPKVQYHSDEPHANLSAVPLYYLAEMASRDLKVVLSGEGADELFGGYDWYIQSDYSRIYKKLPLGLRRFLANTAGKLPQKHLRQFLSAGAREVEDTYIGQAFIMSSEAANGLLSEKYKSDITYRDVTAPYYAQVKDKDELTKKMYLDMNLWLPGDILLKADKMTMAHSLELRVPYLDREVWKVASQLSSSQRMHGRHTKRLFRAAANRHIPVESAERKKAGFMVPVRIWLREEKYASRVREMFERDFASEFFDVAKLISMLDKHVSGEENNARAIYTVYSFLLWYEQYFVLR